MCHCALVACRLRCLIAFTRRLPAGNILTLLIVTVGTIRDDVPVQCHCGAIVGRFDGVPDWGYRCYLLVTGPVPGLITVTLLPPVKLPRCYRYLLWKH